MQLLMPEAKKRNVTLRATGIQQPLSERLLGSEPPNVSRLKELLATFRQADQHAAEIISHVKNLLKRRSEVGTWEFDLNAGTSRSDPLATGQIESCDERHGRDGEP